MSLKDKLFNLCEEYAKTTIYELVNLTYQKEHDGYVLRIYIDKENGGITHTDCETVSMGFEAILDKEDIIKEAYTLEVSSPGLDRPLVKLNDFDRFKNNDVKIVLKQSLVPNTKKLAYTGILIGIENENVILKENDNKVSIPYSLIKKANIVYKF